jgi:hypothetical protein
MTTQLRLFSNEKDAIFIAKSLVRSLSVSAADDTDTTRPPLNSGFTWLQLYVGDQETGQATRIRCDRDSIIDDLTELVKEKYPELNDISSARLVVYPPGTPLDALNDDARLQSWDRVPASSGPQPLMVMAPSAAVPQLGKCLSIRVSVCQIHSRVLFSLVFSHSFLCIRCSMCVWNMERHTMGGHVFLASLD